MFVNSLKVNSVYENSISEFYQYSNIHGYDLYLYNKRYDYSRNIYYMKLDSILDIMIKALEKKTYEWIL